MWWFCQILLLSTPDLMQIENGILNWINWFETQKLTDLTESLIFWENKKLSKHFFTFCLIKNLFPFFPCFYILRQIVRVANCWVNALLTLPPKYCLLLGASRYCITATYFLYSCLYHSLSFLIYSDHPIRKNKLFSKYHTLNKGSTTG